MKNELSVLLGKKRMSVSKLSKDTDIAPATLYSLYHEKNKNPDTKTILKLCKYFEVTPNEFFGIEKSVVN
ncbi:helix-turn-helix domain-containing protein [Staphylococcus nepalensis]|uniref:helix-turn-helix domain-containing protein n=1 Tax=Staphylococcus nepalensis TaxID=214473 RepID=UPI000E69D80A|nr:helix-turn-helix transcriptional regulator [Staphylococcus nepalensis]RIO42084.1 XRE family transcriptional regulator [Staphylococcus nepalensis]